MSEIIVGRLADLLLSDSLMKQVEEIFFESSSRKDFKDEEEKKAFHWKYLGYYLKRYPEHSWLSLDGGQVLGYCIGSPQSTDPELWKIQPHLAAFQDHFRHYPSHLHINCSAPSRGRGVGTGLMEACEKGLQNRGIEGIHIMTGPDSRNRAFYKRLGYHFEAELPFQGSRILMMGKKL